jgi:hypothetical protein
VNRNVWLYYAYAINGVIWTMLQWHIRGCNHRSLHADVSVVQDFISQLVMHISSSSIAFCTKLYRMFTLVHTNL